MDKETQDYIINYYLHLLPFKVMAELKYPYLSDVERQNKQAELANIVMNDYKDQVFFNNCPECGRLARTPTAKQCRHCGHDWH